MRPGDGLVSRELLALSPVESRGQLIAEHVPPPLPLLAARVHDRMFRCFMQLVSVCPLLLVAGIIFPSIRA